MQNQFNIIIKKIRHKLLKPAIVIVFLSILIFHIISHSSNKEGKLNTHPVPVTTFIAKSFDIPVEINALGTVTSTYNVTITPQISGQLTKVIFKEGQKVRVGDVIAEIDTRAYQAQLIQYEGQLERDIAMLDNATLDLKRYKELWEQNSISQQVLDTQIALVKQYEGTVKLDKGLVDAAKVNLSYCFIISPIDGQVGLRLVDEGNIVKAGSAIATINTLNPINVVFSITENDLPKVLLQVNKNKLTLKPEDEFRTYQKQSKMIINQCIADVMFYKSEIDVFAYDNDQKKLLASGKLLAIDNQIDNSTGTIKLKAEFPNNHYNLFPNQFVNIKLLVDTLKDALVIPTSAIQHGPEGNFVYKIGSDNKVEATKIETGIIYDNYVTINSGVSKNDLVVLEGVDKLTNGTLVSFEH